MKRSIVINASSVLAFTVCLGLVLFVSETQAADNPGNWRHTYDLVMRWLNFVILAFLLIKFGKNPIMNILRQRKAELQREIKRAEEQRNNAKVKVNELRQKLENNVTHLEEIKQRIINRGENKKKEIIQKAQAESKILLMETKRRIEIQILSTKKIFQAEMIDEAMKTVFDKLPRHITPADNQKFLELYLAQVSPD